VIITLIITLTLRLGDHIKTEDNKEMENTMKMEDDENQHNPLSTYLLVIIILMITLTLRLGDYIKTEDNKEMENTIKIEDDENLENTIKIEDNENLEDMPL